MHASTLDGDELDEFTRLSGRIGAAIGAGAANDDPGLSRLLIARRRIIETGASKIALLRAVLAHRGPRLIEHALIYASAKDPRPVRINRRTVDGVGDQVVARDPGHNPIPRGLDRILGAFASGACQVVLAKKVLDEGVDIPSIREAFIVASSTVEREWVQRRGRVLRKYKGKPWAIVHDFLALPPVDVIRRDDAATLTKIVRNELRRAYTFGAHARNVAGTDGVQADLDRISAAYWPPDGTRPGILETGGTQVLAAGTPRGRPW